MPGLLLRRSEEYFDKLEKLNNEIKPLSYSSVDEFIVYMKKVELLNETIDEFKPEYDFIDALKIIIIE